MAENQGPPDPEFYDQGQNEPNTGARTPVRFIAGIAIATVGAVEGLTTLATGNNYDGLILRHPNGLEEAGLVALDFLVSYLGIRIARSARSEAG